MKKSILLCSLIFLLSCSKTKEYRDNGILTGVDYAMCPCCGGVILQIDTSYYRIEALPGMSQSEFDKLTYPKSIDLDWSLDKNCGNIKWVKVTAYKFY